jgi:predicted ATPase
LLAPLVDIPVPSARAANLPPEELRRRQLAAMTAWVLAGARSQPAVVAFEDLHWADPTSLDLLRGLAERGAQAPLLLLATARPEFRPPWSLRSHHSIVSLRPLDRAGVAQMVGELSARHALSREVVEGVSERTGGVPLFVEEVTRLLLERGEQGGVQAIPPTLQQSLAARLDRLGPAREIAQIGAVLGRDFAYALLRDVAETDEPALQSSLDRLTEADLLFVEGAPPQASYRFKHALIQDAAYDSLLKSRRQALHRRAAGLLIGQLERAATEPEVIAHHFTQAGLDDLAIEWWGRAGDLALRRSAFQEAIVHLGKAIEMADKAANVASQGQKLHVAYGNALFAVRGYGAPETADAFARARELALGEKEAPERLAADYGLWVGSFVRCELSAMRLHAEACLRDVEARPDSPEAGVAHRTAGRTHWFAGEYREAREHLERALALFQPGRDDDLAFRFGVDAGVAAMLNLATTLWPLGDIGRAVSLVRDAETRSAALAHTRAFVTVHAAVFALMRGDLSRAASNAAELTALTHEHDHAEWREFGVFLEGLASAQSGALSGGLEAMCCGLLREQPIDGLAKIALAETEARAGDIDGAVAVLDEALARYDRSGHRAYEAELHRVRGEILLKRDPTKPTTAEEALRTAIAVARRQATRSFELRAAVALAKLCQSTGRPAEAHAVLAPALDGFAPTPEMPEIAEGEALLAALSETDEVKAAITQRDRLARLHVARGNALIAARGYGARETSDAFAMALAASGGKTAPERLAADFGLWVGAFMRGEVDVMRAHAATFLADASAAPNSPEAGVAERIAGLTQWFAGAQLEARPHLERALNLFEPGRDDDLAFRFGHDAGVGHMANLAICLWMLGEVGRAVDLMNQAEARASSLPQAASRALGNLLAAVFNLMRHDRGRAAANGARLAQLAMEHDLEMWRAFAVFFDWGDDPPGSAHPLDRMRRGLELLGEQGVRLYDGLLKSALASEEAKAGHLLRAIELADDALANSMRTGHKTFDAELHRVRGEALSQLDPDNTGPGEEALRRAIDIARQQEARSFELRAALSLGKLYQSTGRPAEAHAVLAPALEGFSLTPEMPEIGEAQALLEPLAATEEVKAEAERRQRRQHLQVSYGNALIAARGFGAAETTEAFARARDATYGEKDAPERLAADFGLWAGSYTRGELTSMRAHAAAFLADVAGKTDLGEAGIAYRRQGITAWFAGEYLEARDHLERALASFQPGRDDELAYRFGMDPGVPAMAYLALVLWSIGEVDNAIPLVARMRERICSLSHANTLALGTMHACAFELMRNNRSRLRTDANELVRIVREHDLRLFRAFGEFFEGWVTADGGALAGGLEDMRGGAASLREQNALVFDGVIKIALSEAEARAGDLERAIETLDEALGTADRTGFRAYEAELHRARGEMLLKREPPVFTPAEQALRTAVAVARQQGTRAFELRAALSLAKLYQSTARPLDAHAVLTPALEAFSPTSEMPEIAEAQALLAVLADANEVKAAIAQRQRRLHLQTAYGNALFQARGFGAPETADAFAKARKSTHGPNDARERLATGFGLWAASNARGELSTMRAHAAAFLDDVKAGPDWPEAGIAHRVAGTTHWFAGEYTEAREHLDRALGLFRPGRDDDLAFRFGQDAGVSAMLYLALTLWPLGDIEHAVALVREAEARSAVLTHIGTRAFMKSQATMFELMRGDLSRAGVNAIELARLAREHDLPMWRANGVFLEGLVSAQSGSAGGLEDMRRGIALLREHNVVIFDGLIKTALAEAEARAGGIARALAVLDEALATSERTGHRAFDAELYRARGEMLQKRDPADPAAAEQVFHTAVAVAKSQSTRSFELRVALSLAKLYQSTSRYSDAHAVLAPALEGFSPKPEMLEIAEAQALLERLASH